MKEHILAALREQIDAWEDLLAGFEDAQITVPQHDSGWSIKDEIAHLYAWQLRSIARVEAAVLNQEPAYPAWPADLDPEMEGEPDQLNAWLYETYHQRPWSVVYAQWREGFLRLLTLAAQIPEQKLLNAGAYAWLEGHPLALVLLATYDHHQEHLEKLLARLPK
ncbi:MAG: ClbS/DfsB family four-helix bundle protein [Caldilineaceae bacterium]